MRWSTTRHIAQGLSPERGHWRSVWRRVCPRAIRAARDHVPSQRKIEERHLQGDVAAVEQQARRVARYPPSARATSRPRAPHRTRRARYRWITRRMRTTTSSTAPPARSSPPRVSARAPTSIFKLTSRPTGLNGTWGFSMCQDAIRSDRRRGYTRDGARLSMQEPGATIHDAFVAPAPGTRVTLAQLAQSHRRAAKALRGFAASRAGDHHAPVPRVRMTPAGCRR